SLPTERPGFLALHCQEVGGKNYHNPRNSKEKFLSVLLARPELKSYTRCLIYLDGDTTAADKFTALGSLYFILDSVEDIQTWNFQEGCYVDVVGRTQYTDDLSDAHTIEKVKFPKEFFPECKWSRKGFMRTRWRIYGTELDLINIHLFHDASNFLAMKECPSVYTLNRRRALNHALDRFQNDSLPNVPFFIFGDFNFRLNTKSVIENLTAGCTSWSLPSSASQEEERHYHRITRESLVPDDSRRMERADKRRDSSNCYSNTCEPELVVSKRGFRHCRHQVVFLENRGDWLRPYDHEAENFASRVLELPITFPPSYPFAEEPDPPKGGDSLHPEDMTRTSSIVSGDESSTLDEDPTALLMMPDDGRHEGTMSSVVGRYYAYTRLPAWCDRVLISMDAQHLLAQTQHLGARYDMLGLDTPMGDHKPVCLVTHLPHHQGQGKVEGLPKQLFSPLCLCHRKQVCPAPPEWSLALPRAEHSASDNPCPSDSIPLSLPSDKRNSSGNSALQLKSRDSSISVTSDVCFDVPLSVANPSITDRNQSSSAKGNVPSCVARCEVSSDSYLTGEVSSDSYLTGEVNSDSYLTDQSSSYINPKVMRDKISEVNCLLSSQTISSLVNERFKKCKDNSVVTTSCDHCVAPKMESNAVNFHRNPSNLELRPKATTLKSAYLQPPVGLNDGDINDCDDTTRLITKFPLVSSVSSACEINGDKMIRSKSASLTSKKEDGECVSLTLSADTAELTDDASANDISFSDGIRNQPKDIYSKLELMRRNKRSIEAQHSLNNLLVSDSGSEQVSLGPTAPSLSSLSGVDSPCCRRGKNHEESASQIYSDDSISVKNRPSKDPESVSQFYASEDSASCDKTRLAKDYESISQSPTFDVADVDSINERTKSIIENVRVMNPTCQNDVARKKPRFFKKKTRIRVEANSLNERDSRRSGRCCCS
ncbi:Endonuclease/exonuclease/phosphatase, partial [Trinorchestia longiramus]